MGSPFLPQNSLPFFLSCFFLVPFVFHRNQPKSFASLLVFSVGFLGRVPFFHPPGQQKKTFSQVRGPVQVVSQAGSAPRGVDFIPPSGFLGAGRLGNERASARERARLDLCPWAEVGFYGVFFRFFFFGFAPPEGFLLDLSRQVHNVGLVDWRKFFFEGPKVVATNKWCSHGVGFCCFFRVFLFLGGVPVRSPARLVVWIGGLARKFFLKGPKVVATNERCSPAEACEANTHRHKFHFYLVGSDVHQPLRASNKQGHKLFGQQRLWAGS